VSGKCVRSQKSEADAGFGAAQLLSWNETEYDNGPSNAPGMKAPLRARFSAESMGGGPRTRVFTDSWGRAVATDVEYESGAWLRSERRFDGLGRVVESIEPDGSVVRTQYDLLGRTASSRRYGSVALATSGMTPSRSEVNAYDLDGRLLTSTTISGQTTFEYDASGRLERVVPPSPLGGPLAGHGATRYVYESDWTKDGFGQQTRVESPTETVSVQFDARGRAVNELHEVHFTVRAPSDNATLELDDSYTFAFDYNRAGMPIRIEHRDSGSVLRRALDIEYDSRGRVERMYDAPTTGPRRLLAHNVWRSNGTLDHREDEFDHTVTPLHDWDGAARSYTVARSALTLWAQSIERNPSTRWPTAIETNPVDQPAHTATITHDLSGRLAHVSNPGTSYELHLHRDASNPARTGRMVQNAPGALARDVAPTYRGAGTAGPDPGAITNLLRTTDGTPVVQNTFDPDGTVVNRTGLGATGVMRADEHGRVRERGDHRYFYGASGNRTHVYDAATETVVAHVGLLDIEYKRVGTALVRDRVEFIVPGGNVPLARIDEGTGKIAFMHADAQGSVAFVHGDAVADSVRFEYAPFGEVLSARATGALTVDRERRRFQGGVTDPSGTGYIQFGARLYDPITHQWASADPAFHSYAYGFVHDSPYLHSDPSGLLTEGMPGHEVAVEDPDVDQWSNQSGGQDAEQTYHDGAFSTGGVWSAFSEMVRPRHPVAMEEPAPVPELVRATADIATAAERMMGRLPQSPLGVPATTAGLVLFHISSGMRLPGAIYTTATGRNTDGDPASNTEAAVAGVETAAAAMVLAEAGTGAVRLIGQTARRLAPAVTAVSRLSASRRTATGLPADGMLHILPNRSGRSRASADIARDHSGRIHGAVDGLNRPTLERMSTEELEILLEELKGSVQARHGNFTIHRSDRGGHGDRIQQESRAVSTIERILRDR